MSDPVRVVLTAGFDRARHVVALAELARRRGLSVCGVLVVSALSLRRARRYLSRRGWGGVLEAIPRVLGLGTPSPDHQEQDAVDRLLCEHRVEERSLRSWCGKYDVPYRRVGGINDPEAVAWIGRRAPDWVAYGGGGILGEEFRDAVDGRILNAHAGPLPEVRGVTAAEWTVLLGFQPTVTAHVIDAGIDTGPVVDTASVSLGGCTDVGELRSRHVAVGVELLVEILSDPPSVLPARAPDAERYRQCFTMAPALKELVTARLRKDSA